MPATVNVNMRTVVHEGSNGVAPSFPDTCKTQVGQVTTPIPYPNIAMSTDTDKGSSDVKMDGKKIMLQDSNFKTSKGDEAGSLKGVVSSETSGKAEFISYSFDVKVEGKNVPRLADPMLHNKGGSANTPPIPEVQPPWVNVVV
jgi:hypothetical protein